jgi:hypothetical protein
MRGIAIDNPVATKRMIIIAGIKKGRSGKSNMNKRDNPMQRQISLKYV